MKVIVLLFVLTYSSLSFSHESNQKNINSPFEIGVTILTPGVVNLVVNKPFGTKLKLAVGYAGSKTHGIEIGATILQNNLNSLRSVQVIAGTSSIANDPFRPKKWNYIGMSSSFRFGGFLLEPGISVGSGDYYLIQALLQIGWLWEI